ncbi:MAG: biopolymer transporter ExbD [Phycisphaerae bacterium]|nr:biopolymer transporter ExbD [Phycisphaerae bacterium]
MRIRAKRLRDDKPTLNMASMIDATFLLLSFFLFTTGLATHESRLSPNITADKTSAGAKASDFQPQVVEVVVTESGPEYRLGQRAFRDRESLTAALRDLEKSAGLFVRVNKGPTVGFATTAIQAGHDAGFTQVTYVPAK